MFTILSALALLAALGESTDDKTFHGVSPDDKVIHACPDGWEVGSTDGWEVGSVCQDKDGVTWRFDGNEWTIEEREW